MTRTFPVVVVALAMTLASTGWADEDVPYVEPRLYSSGPNFGPHRPCPHYARGCRDRVRSWLAHLDEDVDEPMRVALYDYGYRSARKESIAAHRAAAAEAGKALRGEDSERALTKDELAHVAKAGIRAFLHAAAEHKTTAAEDAM